MQRQAISFALLARKGVTCPQWPLVTFLSAGAKNPQSNMQKSQPQGGCRSLSKTRLVS